MAVIVAAIIACLQLPLPLLLLLLLSVNTTSRVTVALTYNCYLCIAVVTELVLLQALNTEPPKSNPTPRDKIGMPQNQSPGAL